MVYNMAYPQFQTKIVTLYIVVLRLSPISFRCVYVSSRNSDTKLHDQKIWEIVSVLDGFLQKEQEGRTFGLKWWIMELVWSEFLTIWNCNHSKSLSKSMFAYNTPALCQSLSEKPLFSSRCHFASRRIFHCVSNLKYLLQQEEFCLRGRTIRNDYNLLGRGCPKGKP